MGWADKKYKAANQIARWKKPFGGCSHAAGIIVDKICVEAKQPNSAVRKCVRVQLKKNNKRITAYVPKDGGMSFCDLPGVRFKLVKVANVGIRALWQHKKEKPVT